MDEAYAQIRVNLQGAALWLAQIPAFQWPGYIALLLEELDCHIRNMSWLSYDEKQEARYALLCETRDAIEEMIDDLLGKERHV